MNKLIGVDISKPMIEYAREQARIQQVADRVEFLVMDALLILEFPYDFFDLVNLRFGISFLRTWDWPKILNELQRVSRPGGVIRVTESEAIHKNNSPALMRLFEMWLCAAFRAGHLFEEQPTGLTAHLPALLTQHGIQHVQTKSYVSQFWAGTPEGQAHYEDMKHGFRNLRPFLERRGCLPKDYDTIYQQALVEMQLPDFCVTWNLLTAWGNAPRGGREKAYNY